MEGKAWVPVRRLGLTQEGVRAKNRKGKTRKISFRRETISDYSKNGPDNEREVIKGEQGSTCVETKKK